MSSLDDASKKNDQLNNSFINSAVFNPVRSLQDLAEKYTPQRPELALDKGTQDLIGGQAERANQTPEQIATRQMQGTQGNSQFITGAERPAFSGLNNSDVDQALKARASRGFEEDQNRMSQRIKMGAPQQQLSANQSAYQNLMHQNAIKTQNFNIVRNNLLAKQSARYQVLGTILGLGGAAGGTALGQGNNQQSGNQMPPQQQQTTQTPISQYNGGGVSGGNNYSGRIA